MLDITSLAQQASEYLDVITGGNQLIAGGLTVWALGTASYLLKDIPSKILKLGKMSMTTTMTFNNGGWRQEEVFHGFMKWVEPKIIYSRTASIASSDNGDTLGVGFGTHYFKFKGKYFMLSKQTLESSGSERQKEQVFITVLGRSKKPFWDILGELDPTEDKAIKLNIYTHDAIEGWHRNSSIPKRSLDSIALNKQIKDRLVGQITHFKEQRDWYIKSGIAHKISYIFHGVPGTGKTSLIKALASHFNMDICTLNMNSLSDAKLQDAINKVPTNSFLVFEDFDSAKATEIRKEKKDKPGKLSTTGILNAFDGLVPLDNVILVLTTNHLEHIDPAIYRKGRVDFIENIPPADAESVRLWVSHVFPGLDTSSITSDILGCRLNEALLVSKGDGSKFLEELY